LLHKWLALQVAKSDPTAREAHELATDAVISSPEEAWPRHVFEKVAINTPWAASRALEALAKRLIATPFGQSGGPSDEAISTVYRFALDCITALIRKGCADEAVESIERAGAQEVFDIPLQAINVIQDPDAKQKLATERLSLVEAFLEQVQTTPQKNSSAS